MDILAELRNAINIELEGVVCLRDRLNSECERAVGEIYNCRGRVILSGMGKSGLVAKKIASTMSSIGTPAIFLHPAEGMHGDLGIITPDDVVIAISKSGESSELNNILPVIRKIGATIISITGNMGSTLARLSDITIDIGDLKEACPFNMVPTTSSTVTLVIGDAIAVVLMKMRGFELHDYALLHPGGRLGKRLIMTVAEVMLKDEDNPVIHISESIKNCILKISEKQAGAVSVVGDDNNLLGLITDYDIRKHLEKEERIFSMSLQDIMNPKPLHIHMNEKAFSALEFMQKRKRPINVMPVVDSNNIVAGMLRLQDLVKAGL